MSHYAFIIVICLIVAWSNRRKVWKMEYMKKYKKREKLKVARLEKGLSQHEVAKEIEISRGFYNQIETGERNPRFENALKISKLLNLDVRDWS